MSGYTKLFGSIIASTIWREDDKTRIVWITMLALSNKDGIVEASIPGLADLSRVSVDEARASVAKLEGPDPDSRSKECEGRRIQPLEDGGGWRLVNHAKYRAKMGEAERREYLRLKQQEHRAKKGPSTPVNTCQQISTPSTHTEADTDTDTKAEQIPPTGVKGEKETAESPNKSRIGKLFHRRESTKWSAKELKALKALEPISAEDLELIERYYTAKHPPEADYRRKDLVTLLNNWTGELDRARNFKPKREYNL